jgi:hypothetical protein
MSMLMQEAFSGSYEEEVYVRYDDDSAFVSGIVNEKSKVVKGSLLFKARVRKVLEEMHMAGKASDGEHALPAKFIISSDRVVFDDNLGILYLNRKLKKHEMEDIISSCVAGRKDFRLYSRKFPEAIRFASVHTLLSSLYRKYFRISIEKQVNTDVRRIIHTPPLGKVSTEDQHFLLTIMRLEMFIKSICVKVERHSVIRLLLQEQKKLKKHMLSLQKQQLTDMDVLPLCVKLSQDIKRLDAVIHNKRQLFQNRLINRVFSSIEAANQSAIDVRGHLKNKQKQMRTSKKIQALQAVQASTAAKASPFARRRQASRIKRLVVLKRKHLQYAYLASSYENLKIFSCKLKAYMETHYKSELIPAGFHRSATARLFNVLRFLISILFMGFYLYIIRLPLFLAPFLLVLGLYVFQPISNKFAILFMTKFTNNSGLKRLSAPELKQEIQARAVNGQYLCAVDLPLFTGKADELYTTEYYLEKNVKNLSNTLSYYSKLGIVYQITSNTADVKIVEQEVKITQRVQSLADVLYGKGRIYFLYLHRSSTTAKKVGNIIASHLFKHHGYTSPPIYTDADKSLLTFEPKPLFDRVYGNFAKSLFGTGSGTGFSIAENHVIMRNILSGKKLELRNKVDFSFFVDNKNEIKPGSFEAALAAMMHPENNNITILQPQMSIEDPVFDEHFITSAFLRMMRIARDIHNDRYLATLHGIFGNMSAYYGKGMIRLGQYDYMVMNEILNLKYVDSHDWQESVFNHTALAIGGDTRINVVQQPAHDHDSQYSVLMEKGHESILVTLMFRHDNCTILYPDGNSRGIHVEGNASDQEKITSVLDYLDNKVDVGERELISTIGNHQRDTRWLKGDLQMFHTFAPYRSFMPPYHRFHLGNIFRRFTNEVALLLWVLINFTFSVLQLTSTGGQETLFILTLYLAVTAFGFAGIDLFIYPIFFGIKSRPVIQPHSVCRALLHTTADVFKKIGIGLWQFVVYLMIAWPRVYLGIKGSLKVLATGIDQVIDWGALSNASISAEETSKQGLPLKRFFHYYHDCMIIGVLLIAGLLALILLDKSYISVFLPFNLGIIAVSLILSPFAAYLISMPIRQK